MKLRFLLPVLVLASVMPAAELTINALDVPFFDPSGHLLRRLKAETATGSLQKPVLKNGRVEFFSSEPADRELLGTLTFAEARYDHKSSVVESDGPVHLTFPQGTMTAIGFRYDLPAGKLILKSAVVLDFPEAHVTGDEGEILLIEDKIDRRLLVSSATIRRNVVITEIKSNAFKIDRAETASAIYRGSDQQLSLASPVTGWRNGEKGEMFGEIAFKVGRQKPSANTTRP